MTDRELKQHEAAMRLRSITRRLRTVQHKQYPTPADRAEALKQFWEQVFRDKRTKKGMF